MKKMEHVVFCAPQTYMTSKCKDVIIWSFATTPIHGGMNIEIIKSFILSFLTSP